MDKEGHRLFISFPLERHFLDTFVRYRDRASYIPYLKWTPERKLHMTGLFIGQVYDDDVASLVEMLWQTAPDIQPFSLTLQKVAYAAPGQPVDMVWAYFTESLHLDVAVHKIHKAVSDIVTPMDSYKNGRDRVLPHVTLARFSERIRPRELVDLKQTGLEHSAMVIDEIVLMESRIGKKGSEYEELVAVPLGGLE
jgi:2'-5' RNA ligase